MLLRQCRAASGFHGEFEGFLRDAGDKRTDHPAEAQRNIAGERDDFALHEDAAVLLLHAPPGFHAPEEAVILAGRFFAFVAFAGVLHFRNTNGAAAAVRAKWAVAVILNVVDGIENDGDDLRAAKTEKDAIVGAVLRFDARALDVGPVIFGLVIVVFEDAKNLVESGSRNEGRAEPMVDHSARAGNRFADVQSFLPPLSRHPLLVPSRPFFAPLPEENPPRGKRLRPV